LTTAFGTPATALPPDRSGDRLPEPPPGASAVAIGSRSCDAASSTGTAFPCPPTEGASARYRGARKATLPVAWTQGFWPICTRSGPPCEPVQPRSAPAKGTGPAALRETLTPLARDSRA
jgi:hypothetical protein